MSDKMLVVGLTGQTGSGKTTVSEAFQKNGYAVINADLAAREVTSEPHVISRLGELFGEDVVSPDGTLNRKALAAKVFSDPDELLKMNTILNPMIVDNIRKKLEQLDKAGKKRVLLDAPTLFESGAFKLCSKTVAVLANEETRKQRIMARDNLTEQEALRRMSAQPKDFFYKTRAGYVLHNDSTPEKLAAEVQPIIDRLEKSVNSAFRSMTVLTLSFLACVLVIWGFFLLVFRIQYPVKYEEPILKAAEQYDLPPSLLFALIRTETDFDPDFSENGREGIFPLTAEQLEALDSAELSGPEAEILAGAAYLDALSETFTTPRALLSAYYAGEEQTSQWLLDPALSEDGADFQNIPDQSVREQITHVEGARLLYQKLYRLD